MQQVTIEQIDERLKQLPPDKLGIVYDFVSQLAQVSMGKEPTEAFQTMLASEEILRRDWESPEEEAAWAYL